MKKKIIIGLIVLIGVAAATTYIKSKSVSSAKEITEQPMVVEKLDMESNVYVNGKIVTEETREIQPEIVGKVDKIFVNVGDKVKKGDILANIDVEKTQNSIKQQEIQLEIEKAKFNKMKSSDNTLLLNAIKTAEERWEESKIDYEENKTLFDAGTISKKDLEKINRQVDENKIGYEDAKYNLKLANYKTDEFALMKSIESMEIGIEQLKNEIIKSEVVSGIDGTVTKVNINVGELSNGNNYMFRIQNFDKNVISANISEAEINKIKIGKNVTISGNSIKGESLEGKVVWIAPSSSKIEGKKQAYVEIKVKMNEKHPELRTDFSVNMKINIASKKDAKCIKFEAINSEILGTKYVNLAIEDGSTKKVPVEIGIEGDVYVEIISDQLNVGDKIKMNSDYQKDNQENMSPF